MGQPALLPLHHAHAEPIRRVVPAAHSLEPGAGGERGEAGVGVLVAVLDLHLLSGGEIEAPTVDGHRLRTSADQEGLDAAGVDQVPGAVLDTIQIEVAVDLALDPRQKVKRECLCDTGAAVVARRDA